MTGPRRCSYLTQTLTGVYQAVRMLSLLLKYIYPYYLQLQVPQVEILVYLLCFTAQLLKKCPNMLLEIAS